MKKLLLVMALLVIAVVACGTSKEEAENQLAKIYCDKIFSCEETAAYRPFVGGSEDGCLDLMKSTTEEGEEGEEGCKNYDSAKADECVSCYEGLSCSEFADMMSDATDPCPVCDEVCD
jgi:hypothetical protein